jgi:hypothetical protein
MVESIVTSYERYFMQIFNKYGMSEARLKFEGVWRKKIGKKKLLMSEKEI